jgi:prepilin peptidase dependent protein B
MNSRPCIRPARGLSIVELLVGITVGLFVLAGATMVATSQISDNRRLLMETQVQQDMRTAMDIIVRDIRRSGYSSLSDKLPALGASGPATNAYSPAGSMSDPLVYTYSDPDKPDNGIADAADFRGFKLEGDVIKIQLGKGNWQPLTDSDVVSITKLSADPTATTTYLPTATCSPLPSLPCPGSTGCGDARVVTRILKLAMEGKATHDNQVKRSLETAVRVRNDEVCL